MERKILSAVLEKPHLMLTSSNCIVCEIAHYYPDQPKTNKVSFGGSLAIHVIENRAAMNGFSGILLLGMWKGQCIGDRFRQKRAT